MLALENSRCAKELESGKLIERLCSRDGHAQDPTGQHAWEWILLRTALPERVAMKRLMLAIANRERLRPVVVTLSTWSPRSKMRQRSLGIAGDRQLARRPDYFLVGRQAFQTAGFQRVFPGFNRPRALPSWTLLYQS